MPPRLPMAVKISVYLEVMTPAGLTLIMMDGLISASVGIFTEMSKVKSLYLLQRQDHA